MYNKLKKYYIILYYIILILPLLINNPSSTPGYTVEDSTSESDTFMEAGIVY